MGMVRATQKGEDPASAKVAKAAQSMDPEDTEDFASTKHKGLPEKKKEEQKLREMIRDMIVVAESDLPTTTKRGKTVTVVHKRSGKELVVTDTPSTRKKYKRMGYLVSEATKINIDALLKNPKISKLLKKLSIVKIKSREDVVKVLNYFARNPHTLSVIKPLFGESINEAQFRQGDKFELGKDLDYGDEKLHAGDYEVVRSKGPHQYQLKDTHSKKQYTVRKKDFEKYTKKKQFKQINEAKYKQTYKSITARDKDSRRIWGSQIGHPRVKVTSWSEVEKSGRMKTAYIEIEGDKDWVDAYKKIAFSGKGNFTDVVKSLKESVNESREIGGYYMMKQLKDLARDAKRNRETKLHKAFMYLHARINQSYRDIDLNADDINDLLNEPQGRTHKSNLPTWMIDDLFEGKVNEAVQVNIDDLLKNPKVQKLLKTFGVKRDKNAIIKLLNYFAVNPSQLKRYGFA